MVEKYNIRTDLALEEKERFESDHVEVQGVILTEEYDEENEIRITTVRIETENGAKVMGNRVAAISRTRHRKWQFPMKDIMRRFHSSSGNSLENCFLKERWKRSWWSVLATGR